MRCSSKESAVEKFVLIEDIKHLLQQPEEHQTLAGNVVTGLADELDNTWEACKEEDVLALKIYNDVIILPQEAIGRFNFITFDEDHTIRLHKSKPFYKSGRWDSTHIQLRWGKLESPLSDVSLLVSTYHNINWLVDQVKSINIELKQPKLVHYEHRVGFLEHNVIQFYKNGKKVKSDAKANSKAEETVANDIMAKFDDLFASAGKLFEEAAKFFRPSK